MICDTKEPDTFSTTYANDFIWHTKHQANQVHLLPAFDEYALTKEEKKAFIDLNSIKEISWDEQLKIIKNLYAQRMKTTYHVSYNAKDRRDDMSEGRDEVVLTDNNTTLGSFTKTKVLEPLPTSRRDKGDDMSEGRDEVVLTDNSTTLGSFTKTKVLEPLPTSRRVMGYCRPDYYYTGLSEYQDEYHLSRYKTLSRK